MGAGIGALLRDNGHEVATTTAGRSPRTLRLVAHAGLDTVPDLLELVKWADVLLVVVPPAAALTAAREIATAARATGAGPLLVDLNAVSPSTMERIATDTAGLDLVDGSISGAPPAAGSDMTIYLSGPRAAEVAGLAWAPAHPIVVGPRVGSASAVKMCTASVYKGLSGLLAQALRTAHHHGVLDQVLADLASLEARPHITVALATTKAERFVAEMLEIAATQAGAGLSAELFQAYAHVYADLARTPLAQTDPENLDRTMTPDQVLNGL